MEKVINLNGVLLITSTHGFGENIFEPQTETVRKFPTQNNVPFIVIGKEYQGKAPKIGNDVINNDLSVLNPIGTFLDIAPTVLNLLNIEIPNKWQGKSLI